jgi:alginate O-acetyltransferase complex protein AlgI
MLFNSSSFVIFLLVTFSLYWLFNRKTLRSQNFILLAANFIFYASWDWRFLLLMIASKSVDFYSSLKIHASTDFAKRKKFFVFSLLINVSVLCFFKYFNGFEAGLTKFLSSIGFNVSQHTLNIILPVGLSFYTLQGLGYVIDVFLERTTPANSIVEYFTFISFFPLILAGPIERASNLLSQIQQKREFNYSNAVTGLRQILWGLFKKAVIADNCAKYANVIFNNSAQYSGSTMILGSLFFAFQIYSDFSGYSDMAIGIAKLFNINLTRNFAFPYFSRNIGEFWRRWHISLSSWLFDYIFKPLQMYWRNFKTLGTFLALLVTFIISGIWHGSNWTFIAWGILNALYYVPSLLLKGKALNTEIVARGKYFPSPKELVQVIGTFTITVFAWIFFRSASIEQAISIVGKVFSKSIFSMPEIPSTKRDVQFFIILSIFLVSEWLGREHDFPIAQFRERWSKPVRWLIYYTILMVIYYFYIQEQQFIYFNF